MRQGTLLPPEKKKTFLEALSVSPNVSAAARAADISRRTAYKYRDADPDFAAQWDDALDEAIDLLEAEVHRRAFDGVKEPIGFWQGEHIKQPGSGEGMFVKKHSDTLAIFLMKAHRPERFRDKHEIKHTGEIAISIIGDEEDV